MLSGGYWKDKERGWIQAGPSVLKVLRDHPILQRHLGWVPASTIEPGLCIIRYCHCDHILMYNRTDATTGSKDPEEDATNTVEGYKGISLSSLSPSKSFS